MSQPTDDEKLQDLMDDQGVDDLIAWFEELIVDSVTPGICMNPECSYTTDVEPDCTAGWCEMCDTQSVKSALILGGVI